MPKEEHCPMPIITDREPSRRIASNTLNEERGPLYGETIGKTIRRCVSMRTEIYPVNELSYLLEGNMTTQYNHTANRIIKEWPCVKQGLQIEICEIHIRCKRKKRN